MRQSQLFGKTMRENPADEVAKNAIFLERGGFVYKTMAGVYDYLPLGWRVLERITTIIREEMNAIGGQEMLLSALQPKERWEKTGRWKTLADIMYRFKDNSGREVGLATTHEDAIVEIALRSIRSWRDLPVAVYQIQTKFRDEPRAKSGLIRGREFLMKDLYSFHPDDEDLEKFYAAADQAYRKIYKRCDLAVYMTEASGGTFTKALSHEYQVLSPSGEDWIICCAKCYFAQNQEISAHKGTDPCPRCGAILKAEKSIEVGNIFKLGTKFSDAVGLAYTDEKGVAHPVVMGCYGIGAGRLLATVAETHADERGLVWPEEIAPFSVHLIALGSRDAKEERRILAAAGKLYTRLTKKGIATLFDDRADKSAGEKFADSDLIGIPVRAVISPKTIAKNGIEVKRRNHQTARIMRADEFIASLNSEKFS